MKNYSPLPPRFQFNHDASTVVELKSFFKKKEPLNRRSELAFVFEVIGGFVLLTSAMLFLSLIIDGYSVTSQPMAVWGLCMLPLLLIQLVVTGGSSLYGIRRRNLLLQAAKETNLEASLRSWLLEKYGLKFVHQTVVADGLKGFVREVLVGVAVDSDDFEVDLELYSPETKIRLNGKLVPVGSGLFELQKRTLSDTTESPYFTPLAARTESETVTPAV